MNFNQLLCENSGANIHPELMLPKNGCRIDYSASFGSGLTIGNVFNIGQDVVIGDDVIIKNAASIGAGAVLGDKTYIGEHARVREGVVVLGGAKILDFASVYRYAIIAPGVDVPEHAQIGSESIIPSQKTIVTLGRFGTSKRTITIHGSDTGPRFSIGCQDSVSEALITERIKTATETSRHSASHYREYLGVFSAIGANVQRAYDHYADSGYIEQLRKRAATLL